MVSYRIVWDGMGWDGMGCETREQSGTASRHNHRGEAQQIGQGGSTLLLLDAHPIPTHSVSSYLITSPTPYRWVSSSLLEMRSDPSYPRSWTDVGTFDQLRIRLKGSGGSPLPMT